MVVVVVVGVVVVVVVVVVVGGSVDAVSSGMVEETSPMSSVYRGRSVDMGSSVRTGKVLSCPPPPSSPGGRVMAATVK